MESRSNIYRTAMRRMALLLPPRTAPVVCLQCAGWSSFGGRLTKDVSMGPMCICDANWKRMESYVRTMRSQQDRTSLISN